MDDKDKSSNVINRTEIHILLICFIVVYPMRVKLCEFVCVDTTRSRTKDETELQKRITPLQGQLRAHQEPVFPILVWTALYTLEHVVRC